MSEEELEQLPKFVRGGINLFKDAGGWVIVFSIIAAAAFGAFLTLRWWSAPDEEKPAALKRVKNVVIGAVIGVSFEGILTLILSYFM